MDQEDSYLSISGGNEMTTVKSPQAVPNTKSPSKGSSGFVVFLLLITWLVIAAGFYGIKSGLIESETVKPAISEKLATLEGKIMALEGRITVLEKKMAEASSPAAIAPIEGMNPAEQKPIDTMNSEAPQPVEPVMEMPKPDTGANPALPEPVLEAPSAHPVEPGKEENKEGGKPQTNNLQDSGEGASHTELLEKKSSAMAS